jgi:hypothetical protein
MSVATLPAAEGNRDDLAAFGIIPKTCGVRHPNEFIFYERLLLIDLERFWDDLAKSGRVGPVGNDHILAIDETVWPRRVSGARQWHRKGALAHVKFSHDAIS